MGEVGWLSCRASARDGLCFFFYILFSSLFIFSERAKDINYT
jgi:hypothetical protein